MKLLRIGQVAQKLNCSVTTARKIVKRGDIPIVDLGGAKGHRFEESDIEKFIQKQKRLLISGDLCQSTNVEKFGGYGLSRTASRLDNLLGQNRKKTH